MGAMEDAANLFGAELGGGHSVVEPARAVVGQQSVDSMFDNDMEGDPEVGHGEEGPEPGGDAFEEEQERQVKRPSKQPRDEKNGQFLKNEGPIDDEEEGEGDEGEETDEEGDGADRAPTGRAPDIDPETKVRVKIDGEEREVTFKEATEGYIRMQTFHQRMSTLDTERKEVTQARGYYVQQIQQQAKAIDSLLAELKAAEPAEPNWDELYRKDPNEATRQKMLWDRYKDGKKALADQQRETQQRQQQEYQRSYQEFLRAESDKLQTKFPHWKDSKARERDQKLIAATLKSAGFTPQEIATVADSRMVEIAMKAARFDRLSSKTIRPKSTSRPMPSGPAASSRRSGSNNGDRAFRNHARSQSVESATDAMSAILDQEG